MSDFQHISRFRDQGQGQGQGRGLGKTQGRIHGHGHGGVRGLGRSPFSVLRVDPNPVFGRDSKAGVRWACVMGTAGTQIHEKEGDSDTENEVIRA